MHRRTIILLPALSLMASTLSVWAGSSPFYTSDVEGVGLSGFDPVTYFSAEGPKKGLEKFTSEWKGAKWWFVSAENLKMFQATPEIFTPQYGGYCAFAAAKGALAPGDPHAWTVHDKKLYVNLSPAIRDQWSKDIPGFIAAADANWPGLMPQ